MDSLNVYADSVASTWKGANQDARYMTDRELSICALGLAGEAGEAAEHVKKWLRDGKPFATLEFAQELGDVLYYLCRLAKAAGYKPSDILELNAAKLERRYGSRAEGRFPRVEANGAAGSGEVTQQLANESGL